MIKLYYAIWANLSELPLIGRAAIVIAACLLLVGMIVIPAGRVLLCWLLILVKWVLTGIFLFIERLLSVVCRDPDRYAHSYNRCVAGFGGVTERIHTYQTRLSGFKKPLFKQLMVLYALFIFLVSMPLLFSPLISKEYLPYFSFAANLYHRLETPTLKEAASYAPLFNLPEQETGDPTTSQSVPVMLSLSRAGWNGSNVRAEPSRSGKILTAISGDVEVIYLGDQDGKKNEGWVNVRLPDGTEGWIYGSLLTDIP